MSRMTEKGPCCASPGANVSDPASVQWCGRVSLQLYASTLLQPLVTLVWGDGGSVNMMQQQQQWWHQLVMACLVPASSACASPYHPTLSACPNFCVAGTTGHWLCMQSATVGKDSSELLFTVHSMPTVQNQCTCFLHDASSHMCLPAGLIHRKEGCVQSAAF